MKHGIDEKLLIAYADGELAAEQRRAVERYLSEHAEAAARVEAHRRLSRAARRVVCEDTPPVPLELRAAVEQMLAPAAVEPFAEAEAPAPMPMTKAQPSAWRRWVPLAAAATIVFVLGLVALLALRGSSNDPVDSVVKQMPAPAPDEPLDGTLSPSLVNHVTSVHLKCSRLLDHFIAPEFGRTLEDLSVPATEFLGAAALIPDLSSMNYTFNGAGPCNIPGGRTLHLLYRHRADAGRNLSVFIQPDTGQLKIAPDVLHTAAGPDAAHPMLVWRSRGHVYYIVGDSFAPTDQAAGALTRM